MAMKIGRKYITLDFGMKLPIDALRICPECHNRRAYILGSIIHCDDCGHQYDVFDKVQLR